MAYKMTFRGDLNTVKCSPMVLDGITQQTSVVFTTLTTIPLIIYADATTSVTGELQDFRRNLVIRGSNGKPILDFNSIEETSLMTGSYSASGRIWVDGQISGAGTLDHVVNDGLLQLALKFDPAASTSSVSQVGSLVTLTMAVDKFANCRFESRVAANRDLIPPGFEVTGNSSVGWKRGGAFYLPGLHAGPIGHGFAAYSVPATIEAV